MWPPVNPLWKVCLESLCRLWESLWKLRKMVNLEHLLYWRISPSLLLESAPFFVKNWLLKPAKKFWFCDRALVFQPEIKSALTGCIPISLPSISGLEPFVEEHNKWKWKVNIANGTMYPTLSVRLSRIKRSQVISLAKLGPTLPDFGPIIILAIFFRQLVDRIGIRNWEIRDGKYELGKVLLANCRRGHFSGKVQYSIRACN